MTIMTMAKLFRLATENDYIFIPEIGLWELSFDKRPVIGVRCGDPVTGAFEYNQARLKFFSAKLKSVKNHKEFDFEAVLTWAAEHGSPEQCQFVLNLVNARNISEYKEAALNFIKYDRVNYPYHLDIAIFFTGFETRLTTNHDLISVIKDKSKS